MLSEASTRSEVLGRKREGEMQLSGLPDAGPGSQRKKASRETVLALELSLVRSVDLGGGVVYNKLSIRLPVLVC